MYGNTRKAYRILVANVTANAHVEEQKRTDFNLRGWNTEGTGPVSYVVACFDIITVSSLWF